MQVAPKLGERFYIHMTRNEYCYVYILHSYWSYECRNVHFSKNIPQAKNFTRMATATPLAKAVHVIEQMDMGIIFICMVRVVNEMVQSKSIAD